MGGKAKQSQRTKNNVRPSNSGRSAHLLTSTAPLSYSQSDGSTGKSIPAIFPTLAAANVEQIQNVEYSLCFKKLNKKDPITKTKALQELAELVARCPVEETVAVLPFWTSAYKILCVDPDHKVREATQLCMGAVSAASGRRLAPALRGVLPAWLQASYDPYAPAAAAAAAALQSTFPHGLGPALAHVKSELLAAVRAALAPAPAALARHKSDDPEASAAALERVRAAGLRALAAGVRALPPPERDWLWLELQQLMAPNSYWKMAAAAAPVSAAWFDALGAVLAAFGPQLGAAAGPRAAAALLQAAAGGGAGGAGGGAAVWTCLLLFMHHVPDWQQHFGRRLGELRRRVLELLRAGGWGDAKTLSSMVLPLLAHAAGPAPGPPGDAGHVTAAAPGPPGDAGLATGAAPGDQFHDDFLQALFDGLEQKSILSSKSERQYWIGGIADYVRFLSAAPGPAAGVPAAVGAWLRRALAPRADGRAREHLLRATAAQLAGLLRHWLGRAAPGPAAEPAGGAWRAATDALLEQARALPGAGPAAGPLAAGHVLLLTTMKTAFVQEKKSLSIKFECDSVPAAAAAPAAAADAADAGAAARFARMLEDAARELSAEYVAGGCAAALGPLLALLRALPAAGAGAGAAGLARRLPGLAGDEAGTEALVQVVFLLMRDLPEEEQDAVYAVFDELPAASAALSQCVAAALAHPARAAAAARRWLRGGAARARLLRAARALLAGRRADRALLAAAAAPGEDGELLVSEEAMRSALRIVCSGLRGLCDAAAAPAADPKADPTAHPTTDPKDDPTAVPIDDPTADSTADSTDDPTDNPTADPGALDPLTAAAAQLLTAVPAALAQEFMPDLFDVTLHCQPGEESLSLATWREACDSWADWLAAAPAAAAAAFRARAAAALARAAADIVDDFVPIRLQHIATLGAGLVPPAGPGGPGGAGAAGARGEVAADVTRLLAAPPPAAVERHALRLDVINYNLQCLFEDDSEAARAVIGESADTECSELTRSDVLRFANAALLRWWLLRALPAAALRDARLARRLLGVVHDYAVLVTLDEGYDFWPHHDVLHAATSCLAGALRAAAAEAAGAGAADAGVGAVWGALRGRLRALARERGYYWTLGYSYFERMVAEEARAEANRKDEEDSQSEEETQSEAATETETATHARAAEVAEDERDSDWEEMSGAGYFHSLQARLRQSPPDDVACGIHEQLLLRALAAAHPRALPGATGAKGAAGATGPAALADLYYRHNDVMLFERSLSGVPWLSIVSNAAAARALAAAVRARGDGAAGDGAAEGDGAAGGGELCAVSWDFINIALCSWLDSLARSRELWGSTRFALLLSSVALLMRAVRAAVAGWRERCVRRAPPPHAPALADEWRDVFGPPAAAHVHEMLRWGLEPSGGLWLPAPLSLSLAALVSLAGGAPGGGAPPGALAGAAAAACGGAAARSALAHAVLRALTPRLLEDDASEVSRWRAAASPSAAAPALALRRLRPALCRLEDAMADVESLEQVESDQELRNSVVGYLLLSAALSRITVDQASNIHYIQYYREHNHSLVLLRAAARLLPEDVCRAPPPHADWFLTDPPLGTSVCVWAWACRALFLALSGAGAAGARAAAAEGAALARPVAARVAPHLARRELLAVQALQDSLDDVEITIEWGCGAARAVLAREGAAPARLRLALAPTHPLRAPEADARDLKWLQFYLAHQNASLANGILLWAAATRTSAASCYICYSPCAGGLRCHTCRHRYHTACLHKWFATSNKSTCPLCRAPF